MNRFLAAFLIVFALFTFARAQSKSDRTSARLAGAVKTVKELYYRYPDSKPEARDTVTYDLNGNEIERIVISDFGELIGKQVRKFDPEGLAKEMVFTDPKNNISERSVYTFTAGKLTQTLTYDGKGVLREKTTRTYNTNGQYIQEAYFDSTTERGKALFDYDEKSNAREISFFLSSGQKAIAPVGPCLGGHRITFTYDNEGRVITKSVFDTKGNIKRAMTYTYDNSGNFAVYTVKSGSHVTKISYAYEYDEKGNWVKQTAVSESDGRSVLDVMLEATGKPVTEEERKKAYEEMNKMTTIRTVTTRQISYY